MHVVGGKIGVPESNKKRAHFRIVQDVTALYGGLAGNRRDKVFMTSGGGRGSITRQ